MGHIERRLLEAAKLGFETVIMPAAHSLPTTSRLKALNIIRSVKIRHVLMLPLLSTDDCLKLLTPGLGLSLSAVEHPAALALLFACGQICSRPIIGCILISHRSADLCCTPKLIASVLGPALQPFPHQQFTAISCASQVPESLGRH